jgi:hypothetical protein
VDCHDKPLPLDECITQINQARQRLKDVVANTKEHMTQYEVQLATTIVEHKHPHLAKRSWKKLGRHLRGFLKQETLKRSRLVKIEVPDGDGWKKAEDKEITEEGLMERNIEQFWHVGTTPFGYSDLGREYNTSVHLMKQLWQL